ncbi:inositol phosphate phosphatase SopB [Spartinivicinus ruber]|uniref:inositol phosphate phosphatase SopB n=1 Tax=Spartinivicinus ruber TaxID=2683272 RepID=UPI0013D45A8D|nr:inositol phosphate phosphatase SopB [Spartinivicinus ruber]
MTGISNSPAFSTDKTNNSIDLSIANDKKPSSSVSSFFSNIGHFFQVHIGKKAKSYDLTAAQYAFENEKPAAARLINIKNSQDSSSSIQNAKNLQNLIQLYVNAAHDVLVTFPMHDFKNQETISALTNNLKNFQQQYPTKGFASKEQMKAANQLKNNMENILLAAAPIGKDTKKVVKQELKEAIAKRLNQNTENWQPISKTIEWKQDQQVSQYTSEMIPAARLPSLKVTYQNSKVAGISSMTTNETNHAVNLWVSKFKNSTGKTVFQGVRHGVNTPFAIKDSNTRAAGADKRTHEVIQAALETQKEQLIAHLQSNRQNEPFQLKLTSTSLLTPSQFYKGKAYKERQFIQEQLLAWERASKEPKKFTININGENKEITVKLDVLAFNFGVNGGAKLASKYPMLVKLADKHPNTDITGWKLADRLNNDPLNRLLNWAVNYKEACTDTVKKQRIQSYMDNIAKLKLTNQHRLDGNRAYALPEQVVLLSNEIGVVPAWNCMSGKDRTGLLDAEIKQSLIEQELNDGKAADFSSAMIGERQKLHDKMLLESGNHEIQQANTGVPGYKIFEGGRIAVASNANNIAEPNRAEVQGLSGAVSA